MRSVIVIVFVLLFIFKSASAQGPVSGQGVHLKGYYGIGDNYRKLPPSGVLYGYETPAPVSPKGYYSFHQPKGFFQVVRWKTAGRQRLFNRKGYYGICKLHS